MLSLVFSLTTDHSQTLAAHLGRASHQLFLQLIDAADPALAKTLHEPNQPRPFTCSTLWGAKRQEGHLHLQAGTICYLRFTSLTQAVSVQLHRWSQAPPPVVELDHVLFNVVGATVDAAKHPWAGGATFEALSAPYLLAQTQPTAHVELEFSSLTAFRSAGRTMLLPLPELVFGGLALRWNHFAPVSIAEEVRRYAAECLAISRYRLRTAAVEAKDRSKQIGFVGRCRYTALNHDRYWLGLIQMLADFAFFAGVGYQTSVGLGQARRAMSRP